MRIKLNVISPTPILTANILSLQEKSFGFPGDQLTARPAASPTYLHLSRSTEPPYNEEGTMFVIVGLLNLLKSCTQFIGYIGLPSLIVEGILTTINPVIKVPLMHIVAHYALSKS